MRFLVIISLLFVSPTLWPAKTEIKDSGESVDEVSEPKAAEKAKKYFRKSKAAPAEESSGVEDYLGTSTDHYLAIHLGAFVSSDTYKWGETAPARENRGSWNFGVTYRISPVSSLADWAVRADFLKFDFSPDGEPLLLDVIPMLMFPDSSSRFPLYFGLGVGPGFFFKQLKTESFIALSYQLIAGVRLFNVVQTTGFFLEGGMKNHVHMLSDGQFNGYFFAGGALFTF